MSWTKNFLTSLWNGAFEPDQKLKDDMDTANNVRDYKNQGFSNAAQQYGNLINSNTGANGYNQSFSQGMNDGTQMYKSAYNNARGDARSLADEVSQMQAGKAASAATQAARPLVGRGAAALLASKAAADAYANTYGNNFNNQFGNLMNSNLGAMNNQQNAANQQLANQLNAQGTLMGAQLTNDQAEYNQAWNNQKQGGKANNGLGGFIGDVLSDGDSKNKTKVGLPDKDLRMVRYEKCGEKLRHMNPNRWEELKWRTN